MAGEEEDGRIGGDGWRKDTLLAHAGRHPRDVSVIPKSRDFH